VTHVVLLGDSIFDNAAYVAAEAAIAVLSLTGGSEYLEFAIAMVMFVAQLLKRALGKSHERQVLPPRLRRWRLVRGPGLRSLRSGERKLVSI
jgi:hypothetical protein